MPHIHDNYDFVVTVPIVFEGKVLLIFHPKYEQWMFIGGHIELDEDPEQALLREVHEETELEVSILGDKPSVENAGTKFIHAPRYVDVHAANLPHKHIALVYFAVAKNNKYTLSDEHSRAEWLGLEDLEKQEYALTGWVKFYCREAIKAARAALGG